MGYQKGAHTYDGNFEEKHLRHNITVEKQFRNSQFKSFKNNTMTTTNVPNGFSANHGPKAALNRPGSFFNTSRQKN